jgi:MerR family redox-sensitive transcriptional activator SoxR
MTIGEVAARAGIATSAVRYYEAAGLLPPPPRTSGQRRYGPDVLQRLAVVRLAKQAGFSIDEIHTLMHGFAADTPPAERWRRLAEHKLPEIEAQIATARAMQRMLVHGLQCNCLRLEECGLMAAAAGDAASGP